MSDNYHGRYKLLYKNGTFFKWIPCPKCSKGLGLTKPCGTDLYLGAKFQCLLCVRGKTFSPGYNKKQCQKCKSIICHEHELLVGHCNRKEDTRRCGGTCIKGFSWSTNATEPCQLLNSSKIAVDIKTTTNTSTTVMTTGGQTSTFVDIKTTTNTSTAVMTNGGQTSTLTVGSIIGIGIGTALVLVCLILLLIWCYKMYKSYLRNRCCHDDVSIDLTTPQKNNNNQENSIQTSDGAHQSSRFDGSSETEYLLNSDATASLGTHGTPTQSHKRKDSVASIDLTTQEFNNDQEKSTQTSDATPSLGTLGTPTPRSKRKDTECKVKIHKVYNMTPDTYRMFGQYMDKKLPLGNDGNALGSHLGYRVVEMAIFKRLENPTEAMLDDWGIKNSKNTVLELAMIIKEKMKRVDALELLEKELNDIRLKCNCDNCPQMPSNMEGPASL